MLGPADVARLGAALVGEDPIIVREGAGWDHVAWRVQGRAGPAWIIRAATVGEPDERAREVRREVAVMQLVRGHVGGVVADARVLDEPAGCLAHQRIAGSSLQELLTGDAIPEAAVRRIAHEVGALIAAIAAIDPRRAGEPVPIDDDGPDSWRADARGWLGVVERSLEPDVRAAVHRFLATGPPAAAPADALVLAHDDLGAEHVLVDPATFAVTGIIDWSDAAVADPATDLGRLLRDLGAAHLDDVLDGVGASGVRRAALAERAWCYARCVVLEDLAYAVRRRPDLVELERASTRRLFAGL